MNWPYRKAAKVEQDLREVTVLSAANAKVISDIALQGKQEKTEKEFHDTEVVNYWVSKIEPDIKAYAKRGITCLWIMGLSTNIAKAIEVFALALGYRVVVCNQQTYTSTRSYSNSDSCRISWG